MLSNLWNYVENQDIHFRHPAQLWSKDLAVSKVFAATEPPPPDGYPDDHNWDQIKLDDMFKSVFLGLLIGIGVSCMAFIFEILVEADRVLLGNFFCELGEVFLAKKINLVWF